MSRLRIVSLTYYLELTEEVQEKYEYVREDVCRRAWKEGFIRVTSSNDPQKQSLLTLTCHHRYLNDEDAAWVIRLIETSEEYKYPR